MKLKNYQEDIVLRLTELVLQDYPEIQADEKFIHDIAAFTLNRITPSYIMSERGFTRFATKHLIDEDKNTKGLIEVMVIINMAIEYLKSRRKSDRNNIENKEIKKEPAEPVYNKYIYNFPQFIGRVIDKANNKPIIDACITLYIDGNKAKSIEANWPNPYHTVNETNGFYSFWPKSLFDSSDSKKYKVELKITHKNYLPSNILQTLKVQGTYQKKELIEGDKILKIPICHLIKNK